MKNIYVFIVLIFSLCLKVNAQNKADKYIIIPVQAGTIMLSDSHIETVSLDDEVKDLIQKNSSSYYVIFTSINNSEQVSILNKNNYSFTAKVFSQSNNIIESFDYVIFLKRKIQTDILKADSNKFSKKN